MDYLTEPHHEAERLNRRTRRALRKLQRNPAIREILAANLPREMRSEAVAARSAKPLVTLASKIGRLRGAER